MKKRLILENYDEGAGSGLMLLRRVLCVVEPVEQWYEIAKFKWSIENQHKPVTRQVHKKDEEKKLQRWRL